MRHFRLCDFERRLWTFPGGQNFSFPEPVRRNLLATAFTVFILPSLLCFTTVLTGTMGTPKRPVCRREVCLLWLTPVREAGERERLEKYLQSKLLASLSIEDTPRCIIREVRLCLCRQGEETEIFAREIVPPSCCRLLTARKQVAAIAVHEISVSRVIFPNMRSSERRAARACVSHTPFCTLHHGTCCSRFSGTIWLCRISSVSTEWCLMS